MYQCDAFTFNSQTGELCSDTGNVRLEPTIVRLLVYFIENQHRLIERDELLKHVWRGKIVSDDPINRGVSILRQALDEHNRQRFIQTIPRRGYKAEFPQSTSIEQQHNDIESKPAVKLVWYKKLSLTSVAIAMVTVLFTSILMFSKQAGAPTKFSQQPVLAVLPFLDKTTEQQFQYIGDGFADSLIGSLSRAEQIQVIARTSSFAIDHKNMNVTDIAKSLNANFLLEGSVSVLDGKLLINARLIDVVHQTLVWSSEFKRSVNDALLIQSEISSSTISAIVGSMIDQNVEQYRPPFPAYQQVMLGLQQQNTETTEALTKAIEHFQTAIRLDEDYALAYSLLASAIFRLNKIDPIVYEYTADNDSVQSVAELLNIALSIDPTLPDALALSGRIALQERRYAEAEELLTHSIQRSPSNTDAHADLAQLLFATGRAESAIISARKALQLNPQSNANHQLVARILWQLGRAEEAMVTIRQNVASNPSASNNYSLLSRWSFQLGQPVDAVIYAAQEWQLEENNANKKWRVCISLLQVWYWELANECIDTLLTDFPDFYEAKKYQLDLSNSPLVEAHIKRQIEAFPDVLYFKLQLAHYYDAINNFTGSIEILTALYPQLLSLSPKIDDYNMWGARILGRALLNTGATDQGERILKRILEHIERSRKLQSGGFSSGTDDVYVLAALGYTDTALDKLAEAIEQDWLFYSFLFFNRPGATILASEPEFDVLKAEQQAKMLALQQQLNARVSLSFVNNTAVFH